MNPLIIKVEAKREKLRLSLMELSEQVGIPYDRMYKWVKRGTNPKVEDARKLEAWLSGDPITQINVEETQKSCCSDPRIESLDAAVIVLQTKMSQLLADKTGRSSLIELENIKKEVRDVIKLRQRES